MEFQNTVVFELPPVSLMVVGRATKARPAANFHTRFCLACFVQEHVLIMLEFVVGEVVRNSIIASMSQANREIIGTRFSTRNSFFVSSREGLLSNRKPATIFSPTLLPFDVRYRINLFSGGGPCCQSTACRELPYSVLDYLWSQFRTRSVPC